MTNLDVLRAAAAQQSWVPRPVGGNDSGQKVTTSWSPPRAAVAEQPHRNGVHNLLHRPPSPHQRNQEKLNSTINRGIPPNFLQILDLPTATSSSSSLTDYQHRNSFQNFSFNNSAEYSNRLQQEATLSLNQRANGAIGFSHDASHSPLSTSTPSPSTSPQHFGNYTGNRLNNVISPKHRLSHNVSNPSSYSSGSSPSPSYNLSSSLTPCFNPEMLGSLGAVWGLPMNNGHPKLDNLSSLGSPPLGSSSGTHRSAGLLPSSQGLNEPIRGRSKSIAPPPHVPYGLLQGAAGFGNTDIPAPRNCSDLIRSMAAKYNNRINLYNTAMKSISQSFNSVANIPFKQMSSNTVPSVCSTTTSVQEQYPLTAKKSSLEKPPAHHPFSFNTPTGLATPSSTTNNSTNINKNTTLRISQAFPSTNFPYTAASQNTESTSEMSSAQMLMNLVNVQQRRLLQQPRLQNEQAEESQQLQIQQRQYAIDNYLRNAKRVASTGVTPLDLSSAEPIQKRQKIDCNLDDIDVEGENIKSEPSTPLDVGTFSPLYLEKKELGVFGDLFSSKDNSIKKISNDSFRNKESSELSEIYSNSKLSSTSSSSMSKVSSTAFSPQVGLIERNNATTTDVAHLSLAVESFASTVTCDSSCHEENTSSSLDSPSTSQILTPSTSSTSSDSGENKGNCSSCSDPTTWTVEEVHDFVQSIDICTEYADLFRNERIDGWSLSLLTESHLTDSLHLKLGPALKLRSVLDTKIKQSTSRNSDFCNTCVNEDNLLHKNNLSDIVPTVLSCESGPNSHNTGDSNGCKNVINLNGCDNYSGKCDAFAHDNLGESNKTSLNFVNKDSTNIDNNQE